MPEATAEIRALTSRPEHELLLCCARAQMDSGRADRIQELIREGIDWTSLVRTALPHGMMPLLYWHLQAVCPETVPGAILAQLRGHFRKTVQNNLLLTGELLQLLELLETHGILAIPYKGPVLATSVYGSLWLRQFRDLDVLVHAGDISRARDLLISRGYRTPVHVNGAWEAAFIASQCKIPLARAGRLLVELHWGLTPRCFSFPLDPEGLWGRLQTISLAGRAVPSLPPEDLLLILCVHGCRHLWERLEWVCDVAELLRVHPALNWGRVTEQARNLGSERMLFLGVLLASHLLGAAVPGGVLEGAQADRVARLLAAQVCRRLSGETDQVPGVVERCLFHVAVRERLRDRLRYCSRMATVPTQTDWALLPLPRGLWFLYSLLRPLRILGRYGLRPLAAQLRLRVCPGGGLSSPPVTASPGSPFPCRSQF